MPVLFIKSWMRKIQELTNGLQNFFNVDSTYREIKF